MLRRFLPWVLVGLAALSGADAGAAKPTPGKKPAGRKVSGRGDKKKLLAHVNLPPPGIELEKFDLLSGVAQVLVSGTSRPPDSRFFAFMDDRRRRFVPSLVECHPQEAGGPEATAEKEKRDAPSGRWRCALGIPRIYQRGTLIGLSVQVRGQTVNAAGDKVQAAWVEARSTTPLPAPGGPRPRDPAAPWSGGQRRTPDAGPTVDHDGVDSEVDE